MFELLIRLQHDCPHNELSKKYPKAQISLWCNTTADILEIDAGGFESYQSIQKEVSRPLQKNMGKVLSKTMHHDKFQVVAKTCSCGYGKNPTEPIFEKHDFMEIPPVILTDGWEHYRLVGFEEQNLKELLASLDAIGKVEVLQKRSIAGGVSGDAFLVSLSELFGQLTKKQLAALTVALESGYYEVPKRLTTEALAQRQRQPRSTVEEHIRKAESKVLHAVAPFMMMVSRAPHYSGKATRFRNQLRTKAWNSNSWGPRHENLQALHSNTQRTHPS